MRSLLRANLAGTVTQRSNADQISKRLMNALAISVLMGLTWVFGFLAIGRAKFAFSLLFCVCNSFQGVAVFALFCLRQPDVKKTLLEFFPSKFRFSDRLVQSKMASTGAMSSTSQSHTPYKDMDFSLAKIPNVTPATNEINEEGINPVVKKITPDVTEPRHEKKPSQSDGDTKSPLPVTRDMIIRDKVSENGGTVERSIRMIDRSKEIKKVRNQPDDDVIERINWATVPNQTRKEAQISFVSKPGSEIRPTHAIATSNKMSMVVTNTIEANATLNQARAPETCLEMSKRESDIKYPQDHDDAKEYQYADIETNERFGIAPKAKKIRPPSRSLIEVDVDVSAYENQDNTLDQNEEMQSDDDDDVMFAAIAFEDENSIKEAAFEFDL